MYLRGGVASRADTVAMLWDLSLNRAIVGDLAAIRLPEICSHLVPEPVPLDLVTGHADQLLASLSAAVGDPLAFTARPQPSPEAVTSAIEGR